jgi:ABC-2 type transport system ATP-binding protein
MSAVAVEHLSKRYGPLEALADVSFEVACGQTVAMLGPNGAGKSTTMELLEGYQAPSGGTARVLGVDPGHAGRAWRARIGLVLQSTSLDLHLTVGEALAAFAGLFPDPRPVGEVLELIDLADEADTRIGQLSGGQQRRVDVGLGIVGRPELLFLDEPTTGLDPEARRRAWAAVQSLTAAGTTVLLTTHYLEEAQQLADRVLVLAGGRILADARPDELRRHSAPTSIRYRLPPGVPTDDLPAALAGAVDHGRRELALHTTQVTAVLAALTGWAWSHNLDLAGLEVGAPSLEDAYLALIAEPSAAPHPQEVPSHG